MGSMLSCFCPRSPESEPLLFNAKQFTRYEIVLHKPPPKDWLIVKNIARDEFVVDRVNYYILKEWGVKPGHLLRRVQKDAVQQGVNPLRAMDKKKYPLTMVFAKKRPVIKNAAQDDEDSSDISRDSFVSIKGVDALYKGPPNPAPIRKLNHRDLQCKTEELEAALKNLNKSFKKQRTKYVERSKKYKENDLADRERMRREVKQEKLRAEQARTVAGGTSRKKRATSMATKTKADSHASGVFEGYLMKYGDAGRKKPKRKWVKFFLDTPKNPVEDYDGNQLLLEYSEEKNDFERRPDSIKQFIVLHQMESHEFKIPDEEDAKTAFGVFVYDEKTREKGMVFSSESEDTKKNWTNFLDALTDRLKTHGDDENLYNKR